MKRRLLNLVTAATMMLCVAACVLWVRSYVALERRGRFAVRPEGQTFHTSNWEVAQTRGVWWVTVRRTSSTPANDIDRFLTEQSHAARRAKLARSREPASEFIPASRATWPARWGFTGWAARFNDKQVRGFGFGFSCPHWVVIALSGPLPLVRGILALVRRRRFPPGHCRACGYDLRATPGRCPECGRAAGGMTEAPAGAT